MLVNELNASNGGISIIDQRFNAFVYADDILLSSSTITGLQELIYIASRNIAKLGLQFNATKSVCSTIGKQVFKTQPEWFLNQHKLPQTEQLKYLGAIISNNPGDHASDRISAYNRSYFSLLPAGLNKYEMPCDVKQKLFMSVCQPTMTYALASTNLSAKHIQQMDTAQAKAIKRSLKLPIICRSTHLLKAFGIKKIGQIHEDKTLQLARSFICDTSQAAQFYINSFGQRCHTNLLQRAETILQKNGNNLIQFLFKDEKVSICNHECGITDSISYLLCNYSKDNRDILCTMLLPF